MYIHEAVKARTAEKPFITRTSWKSDNLSLDIKIYPTNTPALCIINSRVNRYPSRGWEPSAEDLAADDWEITD